MLWLSCAVSVFRSCTNWAVRCFTCSLLSMASRMFSAIKPIITAINNIKPSSRYSLKGLGLCSSWGWWCTSIVSVGGWAWAVGGVCVPGSGGCATGRALGAGLLSVEAVLGFGFWGPRLRVALGAPAAGPLLPVVVFFRTLLLINAQIYDFGKTVAQKFKK